MSLTLFAFILAMIIPMVVFMAAFFMSSRSMKDSEKMSPFECGFDPKASARIPFSLRFFLLAVLFLVFDIEIVLLLPAPISLNFFFMYSIISVLLFLIILILGLFHEWREGSLEWT